MSRLCYYEYIGMIRPENDTTWEITDGHKGSAKLEGDILIMTPTHFVKTSSGDQVTSWEPYTGDWKRFGRVAKVEGKYLLVEWPDRIFTEK